MDKRITACLYSGSAGLLIGLLSFSRWGFFSLLGFYPADLCTPKVAARFFSQGGSINQTIANKIEKDYTVLNCAFINAIKHNSLSSLQYLIDGGANINMEDERGLAPLSLVKSEKAAQLLINNGAKVKDNVPNPLFFAQSRKIAQLLVDNGADINARDLDGHTPLFNQVDDILNPYLYDEDYEFNLVHNIEVVKFLI